MILDGEFTATVDELVPLMVHHIAYHPVNPTSVSVATRIRDLIDNDRDRFEYVCWIHGRTMREAAGEEVKVIAGQHCDVHGGMQRIEIDDAEPPRRAAIRYLNCASAEDRETALAVFATVPFEDLGEFFHSVVRAVVEVVRYSRWEACE